MIPKRKSQAIDWLKSEIDKDKNELINEKNNFINEIKKINKEEIFPKKQKLTIWQRIKKVLMN